MITNNCNFVYIDARNELRGSDALQRPTLSRPIEQELPRGFAPRVKESRDRSRHPSYLIITGTYTVSVQDASVGREMTVILYRGTDIGPARSDLLQRIRSHEPSQSQSRQSRSRTGNRKRRNLTRLVRTCGRVRVTYTCARARARAFVKREGETGGGRRILRATRRALDIISARRDRNC